MLLFKDATACVEKLCAALQSGCNLTAKKSKRGNHDYTFSINMAGPEYKLLLHAKKKLGIVEKM